MTLLRQKTLHNGNARVSCCPYRCVHVVVHAVVVVVVVVETDRLTDRQILWCCFRCFCLSFPLLVLVIAFVLHVFAFGFDCLLLVFVAVVAFVLHVFAFELAWCLLMFAYFSGLFHTFSVFSWFYSIIHRRCCMVDLSSATTGSTTFWVFIGTNAQFSKLLTHITSNAVE